MVYNRRVRDLNRFRKYPKNVQERFERFATFVPVERRDFWLPNVRGKGSELITRKRRGSLYNANDRMFRRVFFEVRVCSRKSSGKNA